MRCKPNDVCIVVGGPANVRGYIVRVIRVVSVEEVVNSMRPTHLITPGIKNVLTELSTRLSPFWLLEKPLPISESDRDITFDASHFLDKHLQPLPDLDEPIEDLRSIEQECFNICIEFAQLVKSTS